MANPSPTSVNIKLMIDTKSQRLLFAEAGKDFVDFLFSIISLPVGTVIRLLGKQATAGSIGNIYESIENLGSSYMLSEAEKDILLKPQAFNYGAYEPDLLLPSMQPPAYTDIFGCSTCKNDDCVGYLANDSKYSCPSCNGTMESGFTFMNLPNKVGGGFVKEAAAYLVTDDLVVMPMSTISIITLLNRFNVKDVGDLQEKIVGVGIKEGVELLRASMQSKTVLTAVFPAVRKRSSP